SRPARSRRDTPPAAAAPRPAAPGVGGIRRPSGRRPGPPGVSRPRFPTPSRRRSIPRSTPPARARVGIASEGSGWHWTWRTSRAVKSPLHTCVVLVYLLHWPGPTTPGLGKGGWSGMTLAPARRRRRACAFLRRIALPRQPSPTAAVVEDGEG